MFQLAAPLALALLPVQEPLAVKLAPGGEPVLTAFAAGLELEARPLLLPARRTDRVGLDRWRMLVAPAGAGDTLATLLRRTPGIAAVEVLRAGTGIVGGGQIAPPNDPQLTNQWTLHQANGIDMDVPEAWGLRGTWAADDELLVGIVDTGYDTAATTPEFAGSVWTNPNELANGLDDDGNGLVDDLFGYDFVNDDNDPYADHDHGTWVSSIVGAQVDNGIGIAGLASGVRFVHAKAFGFDGDFPCCGPWAGTASAAAGLQYCIDAGCQVVNNSWVTGQGFSPLVQDVVQYGLDNGVHLVFSAGNADKDVEWPAMTEGVLSVAAIDPDGGRSVWFPGSASNYGAWVEVSAGGSSVPAISNGGFAALGSGTSAAAPNVTGVVAMLLSEDRDLSTDDLIAIVQEGAVSVDALNPAFAGLLGTGHANAFRSLSLLELVTDLGSGLAGTSAPVLNAWGSVEAGGTFTLSASGATPDAFGALIVGTTRADLPLFGGTLVPTPQFTLPAPSDADGAWRATFTLANGLPPGGELFVQGGFLDLGAPQAIALSNAVRVAQP